MSKSADNNRSDRIFVRKVAIVLGLASLVFITWQLRALLVMLFGAVVIATVFRSLSEPICRWTRLPGGAAVALAILIIFGTVVGIAAVFGAQIASQFDTLRTAIPQAWASLENQLGVGLGEKLSEMIGSAGSGTSGSSFGIGSMIMSIGGGIADALVVIFGGMFLAAQPRFYKTGAIKLVPPGKRGLMADAMDSSERALRMWLKGQLVAMLIVGLLTWAGLWFFPGMNSALALALLAGLLEFIPFAGPLLAAIPAILLALTVGPEMALSVVLLYFAVQQFEGYVLQPVVQQYAVELPGVVLLFSLIAFGLLFGAIGIIFAAPLTVVTYVMVKKLYVQETLGTATPIPGEEPAK